MTRSRSPFPRLGAIGLGALLAVGAMAATTPPRTVAAEAVGPDNAEVVLVLDFSASILNDETSRNQFGAALERIADRVAETTRDLIAGDATVTIVRFASRAADYAGCTDITLLGSPSSVRTLADCLRSVAGDYRRGLSPTLTEQIGIDTNYVAAMEQAAVHLPADAERPTVILFSDGRHDVAGVPVTEVAPARDRLFGDRSPFALLPVGMGLDPALRGELEAGLIGLRTIRDMPACATGAAFEWPEVVFDTPDDAGNAVAVALQNATCTFTVTPTPVPTPPPAAAVQGIRLTPLDGRIEVTWAAPSAVTQPITDYRVRCAAEGQEPIESAEGVSLERTTIVEGLTNGTEYRCEVAVITAESEGEWTPAATTATPSPPPAPPAKPAVEPLPGAVRISVTPDADSVVTAYHYECSPDRGASWPAEADVDTTTGTTDTTAQIGGLANGVDHVCRAFAANPSGTSGASPLSDAVRPCSTFLECSPLAMPILAGIAGVLAIGLLAAVVLLLPRRRGGYVVAVVDVIHTANLGGGSSFGIRFERHARRVDGIVAERGSGAEVRIRKLRGDRFRVTDRDGSRVTESGEAVVVVDSLGVHHDLVLRAFAGKAASATVRR